MLKNYFIFKNQIRENRKFTVETNLSRRFYSRWLKTLDAKKTSIDFGLPWFTFQVIEYLEKNLPVNSKVFEFGGGGSTLFFIDKHCEVVTVEHDEKWFKNIENNFKINKNSNHWHGFFITAEQGLVEKNSDQGNPKHYFSSEEQFQQMNFKKYASKIDDYADEYFDVVLVDGRARPSCIEHSISKIKKGGLLIVDNTERNYYLEYFKQVLSEKFIVEIDVFGPVPCTLWFHKTTVWRKK